MQLLAALAPFVPLGQTLLWVLLIAVLVFWFRNNVVALLVVIKERIKSGSGIKAGWFELADQLEPQPPEVQRRRIDSEAQEAASGIESAAKDQSVNALQRMRTSVLQAEDLALRAIQIEYGAPLSRNVCAGVGTELDAAFFKDGKLFVIEVKYSLDSISTARLSNATSKLLAAAASFTGLRVQPILVLVFNKKEGAEASSRRILDLNELRRPIDIRIFALSELQERFGADAGDA